MGKIIIGIDLAYKKSGICAIDEDGNYIHSSPIRIKNDFEKDGSKILDELSPQIKSFVERVKILDNEVEVVVELMVHPWQFPAMLGTIISQLSYHIVKPFKISKVFAIAWQNQLLGANIINEIYESGLASKSKLLNRKARKEQAREYFIKHNKYIDASTLSEDEVDAYCVARWYIEYGDGYLEKVRSRSAAKRSKKGSKKSIKDLQLQLLNNK